MKHLKSYNEEFNLKNLFNNKDKKIHSICKEHGIENYTINSEGFVDVDGDVILHFKKLIKIPIKFRNVSGNFNCNSNYLTSLEGCPSSVGGNFDCSYNQLTSLEGGPSSVGNNFESRFNELTSLEGGPSSVGGLFDCGNNQLISLVGSPRSIRFGFYCDGNIITSFEGCPRYVNMLYCDNNPIYNVWRLFNDYSKMEFFQDCDIIRDDKVIILDRLNYFLEEIGKKPVKKVEGYKCI